MPYSSGCRRLASATAALLVSGVLSITAGHAMPALAAPTPPTPPTPPAAPAVTSPYTQAQATGEPVEITTWTTPTEQSFANPDGTTTLSLNVAPVRVRHGGTWVGLDPTLHTNPDGGISPAATSTTLTLSSGGSGPLASMRDSDGRGMSLNWPTDLPAPTLAGPTATYPDVLPGVDLRVTASEQGGVSTVLVVQNAAAAANPALASVRLSADTTGVQLSADAAGNITAADSAGRAVFATPAPLMWDSTTVAGLTGTAAARARDAISIGGEPATSSDQEPGGGAQVTGVATTVTGDTITLVPDHDLLSAPTTTWPVYIDPTFNPSSTTAPRNNWTYVNSYYDTTKYWNSSDYARAGYQGWDSPYYVGRSYFTYGIPNKIWGTHIKSAYLQVKEIWSGSNNAHNIDLDHVSSINSSTTWSSRPGTLSVIDTQSFPGDWSDPAVYNPLEQDFDLIGNISSAAASHWSADTFALQNQSETDKYVWTKFQNNPTLAIRYNSTPNTPTNYQTSPNTTCNAGTAGPYSTVGNTAVTFSANVTDLDGTQNPLTLTATIKDKATGVQVPAAPVPATNGHTASIQVPANSFTDGHTYTWTLQTSDGDQNSPATPLCQFTVDQTAPPQPTLASIDLKDPAHPIIARDNTNPGHLTITPAAGSNPARYIWSINLLPPTVLPKDDNPFPGGGALAATGDTPVTFAIVPHRVGPNTVYVEAVDSAGNASEQASFSFDTAAPASADPFGDLTGDGKPDYLAVGDNNHPGLWLYPATSTSGDVASSGVQIGPAGTGFQGTTQGPADWNNTHTSTGDLNADGVQDVLVKLPNTNNNGSNTEIIPGIGDTGPLNPATAIPLNLLHPGDADGSQAIDQVIALPDNYYDPSTWSDSGHPLSDLYAVIGDNLYQYPPTDTNGHFDQPELISSGWTGKTLTATVCATGPCFFARDTTTGALHLWTGTFYTTTNGTGTPGLPPGAPTSSDITYATTGWTPATTPDIQGTDLAANNTPDLWATNTTGNLLAYRNNGTNGFTTPTTNSTLTANPPSYYHPITQTRILDTRNGTGANGPITPGNPVRLQITAANGIPATNITAVAINITVTAATGSGYLTAYPDGTTPPTTSNLTYNTGTTIANFAIVPVSNGYINLRTTGSGTSQLVVDATGYYTSIPTTDTTTYNPIAPARILDTRIGLGATTPNSGGTITLQISKTAGIPADTTAVAMNLTATGATGSGYLTAYPTGTTRPAVSGVQYTTSQATADMNIIALNTTGQASIYTSTKTDIVGDITGYYTTSTDGLKYHPLPATRMLDTRTNGGPIASHATKQISQGDDITAASPGLITTITITQPTAGGYATAYGDGTKQPNVSSIDWAADQTISALALPTAGVNGLIDIYNGSTGTIQLVIDYLGYYSTD